MRVILFFLAALLLVSAQQCPNNCNGQGVCQAGNCVCEADFAGNDCSIPDKLLVNGQEMVGQVVPTRQFRYFHIEVGKTATVYTNVQQTSAGGDIDTYIAVGTRPTKDVYDAKDITSSRDVTLTTQGVTNRTFYVGLYGYIQATATVTVTIVNECPNNCSNAGQCKEDGICDCNTGHAGDDCSIDLINILDNQTVTAQVGAGKWQYFETMHSQNLHDVVQFVVEQKGPYPVQDCDLYLKFEELPTTYSYDFRALSNSDIFKISVGTPQEGHYYAGVYGNSACEFDITLHLVAPECPNKCSGPSHGTCDELTYDCTCDPRYTGVGCETMVGNLGYNLPVEGYVGDNAWNHFTFSTFSSLNALVTVTQTQAEGLVFPDCDLYVAKDRIPTFFDFDYRDITYEQEMSTLVISSGQNTYQVGIHGYTECNYTIEISMVRSCLNNCIDAEHGRCADGTCICQPGWVGSDCSAQIIRLENGIDRVDFVSKDDWVYYTLTVQPQTGTTVYLSESLSVGYLWLYANAAHAGVPTMSLHDYADTETGESVHSVSIPPQSVTTDFIIGVHGSALAVPGQGYEFSLVSYQPVFDW